MWRKMDGKGQVLFNSVTWKRKCLTFIEHKTTFIFLFCHVCSRMVHLLFHSVHYGKYSKYVVVSVLSPAGNMYEHDGYCSSGECVSCFSITHRARQTSFVFHRRISYRFGKTWLWINDESILILWTIPLSLVQLWLL